MVELVGRLKTREIVRDERGDRHLVCIEVRGVRFEVEVPSVTALPEPGSEVRVTFSDNLRYATVAQRGVECA